MALNTKKWQALLAAFDNNARSTFMKLVAGLTGPDMLALERRADKVHRADLSQCAVTVREVVAACEANAGGFITYLASLTEGDALAIAIPWAVANGKLSDELISAVVCGKFKSVALRTLLEEGVVTMETELCVGRPEKIRVAVALAQTENFEEVADLFAGYDDQVFAERILVPSLRPCFRTDLAELARHITGEHRLKVHLEANHCMLANLLTCMAENDRLIFEFTDKEAAARVIAEEAGQDGVLERMNALRSLLESNRGLMISASFGIARLFRATAMARASALACSLSECVVRFPELAVAALARTERGQGGYVSLRWLVEETKLPLPTPDWLAKEAVVARKGRWYLRDVTVPEACDPLVAPYLQVLSEHMEAGVPRAEYASLLPGAAVACAAEGAVDTAAPERSGRAPAVRKRSFTVEPAPGEPGRYVALLDGGQVTALQKLLVELEVGRFVASSIGLPGRNGLRRVELRVEPAGAAPFAASLEDGPLAAAGWDRLVIPA